MNIVDFHHVELSRMTDASVSVVVAAEICDECGERVRYWNEGDLGNAACACTAEGPEMCDRVPLHPQIAALVRDATLEIEKARRS